MERDAAAHRVSGQREARGTEGLHPLDAGVDGHRSQRARLPVAGEVMADGAIAFAIQMGEDARPGPPGPPESVQQHNRLSLIHADILTPAADQYVHLRAFVDELARCGLRDACTSPGSRCTPIVLSLARDRRLRCHSHIDERVAGFFAVGAAKASGRPVAITCTSGTAAAELLPAVIEAREARVPLIVLTADRPPELRDVGAGQAIDQIKLYGDAVKWFCEVGTHDAQRGGPTLVAHARLPRRTPPRSRAARASCTSTSPSASRS